ncbi:Fe-S protein assembly co-chaperone HscB [Iodobacter fluviatilis]|uniref:Co-chaperone protein HscB homolog n=1 Tax=Iodobacter fluviatilis TaxID=537 RepID=A0A377Q2U1_9NEIS|nr:Fe-S protein assembly co-chaperone HscB [Iodobacter fluviatilis]TCU90559.1 co-chaperone protein HscB [Iodobacter fluviatilis]STQ89586.1 Co-chaperone protein hscB homolog [Iodobacter fluviatilis]
MNFDFTQNHFALFDLPARFALDQRSIDSNYRSLLATYHPDRFASENDAVRRMSLQIATQVNEAYQTLKSPIARGRYLLKLAGVDTEEESNTAMPIDFLMNQMEWREAIIDAKATQNIESLENIGRELAAETSALEQHLASLLDETHDLSAASVAVRKLRFMEKLEQEIGDAIETLLF